MCYLKLNMGNCDGWHIMNKCMYQFFRGEPETDQQSKWNDCVFQFLITQTYSGSQAKAECTKLYPPNT